MSWVGKNLGLFPVHRLLGEGSIGAVYLAGAASSPVALKVLLKDPNQTLQRFFEHEVRLLAQLSHPNLVKIFDLHEIETVDGPVRFFSMEYLSGRDLDRLGPGLSPEVLLNMFQQACQGLEYLHARGILHHDLKPSNLIWTEQGKLKILDFSIAVLRDSAQDHALSGTLQYLPPEAFAGLYDERSDLFSLGVIFYGLASGKEAYERILHPKWLPELKAPTPLAKLRPDLPLFFAETIDRMIQLDPMARPSSAAAILRYLQGHRQSFSEFDFTSSHISEKPIWVRRDACWNRVTQFLDFRPSGAPVGLLAVTGPTGAGRSRLLEELRWKYLLAGQPFRVFGPQEASSWPKVLTTLLDLPKSDNFSDPESLAGAVARHAKQSLSLAFSDLQGWNIVERRNLALFCRFLRSGRHQHRLIFEFNSDFLTPDEALPGLKWDLVEVLDDFSTEESRTLLKNALEGRKIDPDTLERVISLSGGRPLLLLENLRLTLEGRELTAPCAQGNISQIFSEVLAKKIADLPVVALQVLSLVSTETEGFALNSCPKLSPETLSEGSAVLNTRGFIDSAALKSGKIQLKHPSLREILLKVMPQSELRAAHHHWMQYHGSSDKVRMMRHAIAIEAHDVMQQHGLDALLMLEQQSRYQEAIEWTEHFLRLSPESIDHIALWALRAPLFFRLARYADALAAYRQWRHLRADDESRLQQVKLHYYEGLVLYTWGKMENASAVLQSCIATSDPQAFPVVRPYVGKALLLLAALEESQGHFAKCHNFLKHALQLDIEDPVFLGEVHQRLGELETDTLEWESANAHFQLSVDYYRQSADAKNPALANNAWSALLKERGDLRLALEKSLEAVAGAKASGEQAAQGRYLGNLALIYSELGADAKAFSVYEKSLAMLDVVGNAEERRIARLQGDLLRIKTGILQDIPDEEINQEPDTERQSLRALAAFYRRDFMFAAKIYGSLLPIDNSPLRRRSLHQAWRLCHIFAHGGTFVPEELRGQKGPADHIINPSEACLRFVARDPAEQDAEGFATTIHMVDSLESPEEQLTLFSLLELYCRRHSLHNLAAALLQRRRRIWRARLQSLSEELRMDYEKNRGLLDIEKLLDDAQAGKKNEPATIAGTTFGNEEPKISETRFRQFCEISSQVSQMRNIDEILERVMDAALILTGAERGFLLLKTANKKGGHFPGFEVKTARHLKESAIQDAEFELSVSLVRKATEQGTTVHTANALEDERFQNARSVHALQLKSVLAVPLEVAGRIYGALYLDHRMRANCFNSESIILLTGFAGQCGLALEKAWMLEALQKTNADLEFKVQDQSRQLEQLSEELSQARKGLHFSYSEIIGNSAGMLQVLKVLDHVTDTKIPVWIWGESGTGKELIARSLHANSSRRNRAFVSENCSSIPEQLLESELFGHRKGAFTHADRDRTGLLEQADGGTLFLDEVADMSNAMQMKLLRALQEGEIRAVGSNQKVKIDVRLVTASNQDLQQLVKAGKFREDLFYRINGMTIRLPPLRERKEDIPALVFFLIKKLAKEFQLKPVKVTEDALKTLVKQSWPGNVRQLESVIRNAMMFAKGGSLSKESLRWQEWSAASPTTKAMANALPFGEQDEERERLITCLKRNHFDKKKVAKDLGITLKSVYARLERHGIPKKNVDMMRFFQK